MVDQSLRALSASSPGKYVVNSALNFLDLGSCFPSVSELVGTQDNAEQVLSWGVRAVIRIVLFYHMRCTELLNVTKVDEIRDSLFLIPGLKRSHSYTIHLPISSCNRTALDSFSLDQPLFPFSYHTIWRKMSIAGMSLRVRSRINSIVTHRGRYDLAEKLERLNMREGITGCLHHKSKSSLNYYLPEGSK